MKVKNRKLALIASMSVLGIGLILFSVSGNKDKAVDTSVKVDQQAVVTSEIEKNSGNNVTEQVTTDVTPEVNVDNKDGQPTEEATPEVTQAITEEATPEPTKDSKALERDAYPEINSLITTYLDAKVSCDEKQLKKCVTNGKYIKLEDIQRKTEYIESYNNIEVYTVKGKGDVDYIAYVYLEIKLTSIDTLAPGMEVFYIRNTDDGYKVVTGEISDKTADYILESKEREDVQALFATVEQKYDDALAKDEMLKEFDKKLEKAAKAKKEE